MSMFENWKNNIPKDINEAVDFASEKMYSGILAKAYEINELLKTDNKLGSITNSNNKYILALEKADSGKTSIQSKIDILVKCIDAYIKFYTKGIKKSKKWITQKMVLNASQYANKIELDGINEKLKFFTTIEFEDDLDTKNIKGIAQIINYIDEYFVKKDLSKLSHAHYYSTINEFKNKIEQITIDVMEHATIINVDDLPKKPNCLSGELPENKKEEKEEKTNAPEAVTKATETVTKETVAANDEINNPTETAKRFEKLKNDNKTAIEMINAWLNEHPEREGNVTSIKKMLNKAGIKLKKGNEIIPTAWLLNKAISSKNTLKESIARKQLLTLLTENDTQSSNEKNNTEVVKKLVDEVDNILKINSTKEFAEAYKNWLNEVTKILNKANENDKIKNDENLKKAEDPYEQICILYGILVSKNKSNDEAGAQDGTSDDKEPQNAAKPAGDDEKANAGGNNGQSGTDEPVNPDTEKTGGDKPANQNNSFHASFQNALNKALFEGK